MIGRKLAEVTVEEQICHVYEYPHDNSPYNEVKIVQLLEHINKNPYKGLSNLYQHMQYQIKIEDNNSHINDAVNQLYHYEWTVVAHCIQKPSVWK